MENAEEDEKSFFLKLSGTENSLLDSDLLPIFFKDSYNINANLKSYLKDSRYPKNFSYAFYLFFTTNDNNELSIHIGCECVNVDFIREDFISDNTKYYNRIVFEFEYALKDNHINVKHREKELEILFFENKQELYNSIN